MFPRLWDQSQLRPLGFLVWEKIRTHAFLRKGIKTTVVPCDVRCHCTIKNPFWVYGSDRQRSHLASVECPSWPNGCKIIEEKKKNHRGGKTWRKKLIFLTKKFFFHLVWKLITLFDSKFNFLSIILYTFFRLDASLTQDS